MWIPIVLSVVYILIGFFLAFLAVKIVDDEDFGLILLVVLFWPAVLIIVGFIYAFVLIQEGVRDWDNERY